MSAERKSIILFLVLTFSLSSIFWYLLSGSHSAPTVHHLVVALMWCPGVSALVIRLVARRGLKGMGWHLGHWKFLVSGFHIPILYALVAYLPVWIFGLGGFPSPNFVETINAKFPYISARFEMPFYLLWLGTIGMLSASCFAALGEEIGWRGFLVPELASITNSTKTAWVSGIVWALWHYPSILFAGYNNGTPVWYALICFTAMVIGFAFIMTWFRLKSKSIWPCVLLHTSHNNFIELFFTPITIDKPATKYFIDEFGIGLAITIPLAAAIIWRIKPGKENA